MFKNSSNYYHRNVNENEQGNVGRTVAYILWLVFPPVLMIAGTIGNGLAILVLVKRKRHDTTSAIYFIGLAAADLSVLYTGLVFSWCTFFLDVELSQLPAFLCKASPWLIYATGEWANWMLVLVTLDRIIACAFPFKYPSFCSPRRAQRAFVVTTALAFIMESHFLFGMDIVEFNIGNETVAICTFGSSEYAEFYSDVYLIIDLLKYSLLPSIILTVGSGIIIVCMYKKLRKVEPTPQENIGKQQRYVVDSSVAKVLVSLNLIFVLCSVPFYVYGYSTSFIGYGDPNWRAVMKDPLWALVNLLMYLNHVLNFFLYIARGKRFRKELRSLMSRMWEKMVCSSDIVSDIEMHG